MTLSYYGFLRISELQNLMVNDIVCDTENKRLKLYIRFSKTDQYGVGQETFIYDNDKYYSPYKLFDMLKSQFRLFQYIVEVSGDALRHHLKVIVKKMGLDPNDYSWHSFRRGGAHQAALLGVSDSEIKKHSRWKSEAYMRYVDVDPQVAGQRITYKI